MSTAHGGRSLYARIQTIEHRIQPKVLRLKLFRCDTDSDEKAEFLKECTESDTVCFLPFKKPIGAPVGF